MGTAWVKYLSACERFYWVVLEIVWLKDCGVSFCETLEGKNIKKAVHSTNNTEIFCISKGRYLANGSSEPKGLSDALNYFT